MGTGLHSYVCGKATLVCAGLFGRNSIFHTYGRIYVLAIHTVALE